MRLATGIEKFKTEHFPAMEGKFKELEKGQAPETSSLVRILESTPL